MTNLKVTYITHSGNDMSPVNAARISRDAQTLGKIEVNDKDKKLMNFLAENNHMTPFEHASLSVLVECPIVIRSQIHRHRTFCVSGNTDISFEKPRKLKIGQRGTYKINVKQLFKNFYKNEIKYKKMFIRVLDTKSKEFTTSHISNVYHNGKKPCFKITLKDGKDLICTENHNIYTNNGWKTLRDAIGLKLINNHAVMSKQCYVYTNGEPAWRNYDWMKLKRGQCLSVQEIADSAGCSYHNIRKWLKIHDLQFDQIQNLKEYVKEHGVWNKGKFGYKIDRIFTEAQKEVIRNARSGDKSNFWKGGISSDRAKIATWTTRMAPLVHKQFNYTCQMCFKRGGKLHAHHIKSVVEYPELSYSFDNLSSAHESCHKKHHKQNGDCILWRNKHKGNTLIPRLSKIINIEYVGETDVYDIEVEHDSHNYIANGIVVHNSYNEISRRYTSEGIEFYIPDIVTYQGTNDKQKGGEQLSPEDLKYFQDEVKRINEYLEGKYNEFVSKNIARENSRMVLPQTLMTKFYMSGNIRNWAHFMKLRLDDHAQYETQIIAQEVLKIAMRHFPETMKILMKHVKFDSDSNLNEILSGDY